MEHGPAGCALKAVRGQEIIYEGYKGYADEKAGKLIGPGTVYRMYSCTKVVTAAAAMLLLERGKMLLDDPVSRYLPEYGDLTWCRYTGNNMISLEKTGTMTIRHLLTMTSGFTYDGIHNTTQQETKRALEEMEVKIEESEQWKFQTKTNQTGIQFPSRPSHSDGEAHLYSVTIVRGMSLSRSRLSLSGRGRGVYAHTIDETFREGGHQMNMPFPSREQVESIRKNYPPGTRVMLNNMNDLYSPVEPGTRGTVRYVDDAGQIGVAWDNGRSLSLIPGVDSFRKLTQQEIAQEQAMTMEEMKL